MGPHCQFPLSVKNVSPSLPVPLSSANKQTKRLPFLFISGFGFVVVLGAKKREGSHTTCDFVCALCAHIYTDMAAIAATRPYERNDVCSNSIYVSVFFSFRSRRPGSTSERLRNCARLERNFQPPRCRVPPISRPSEAARSFYEWAWGKTKRKRKKANRRIVAKSKE